MGVLYPDRWPSKARQRYNFLAINNHIIKRCAFLRFFSPPLDRLEPDWMAKAAAMKLPHKGQATSAAFDSQAAHRID